MRGTGVLKEFEPVLGEWHMVRVARGAGAVLAGGDARELRALAREVSLIAVAGTAYASHDQSPDIRFMP